MKTIKKNNLKQLVKCVLMAYFLLLNFTILHAQNSNKNNIAEVHTPGIVPPTPDSIRVYGMGQVTVDPIFPVDIRKYISDSIQYPEKAKEKKIQGTVYLSAIIEKNGSVSNVIIIKSPDTCLNTEAKRVVLGMPKWKPGQQKGIPVRVNYLIAVRFNLPADSSDSTMKK